MDIALVLGISLLVAEPVDNGFWYDAGRPHTLNLNVPGIAIGVAGEHWRVEYMRSGKFRSDAIALASDPPNTARYVGHGRYDGVQALYEWRYATVGILAYVPRWEEHTDEGGRLGFWPNRPNLHVAPVVGLRYGPVSLTETFMCISDRCKSGVYPPIWKSIITFSITIDLARSY